jgi:putative transposase
MGHTHTRNLLHIVTSTKERRPILTPAVRAELFPYMIGIAQQLQSPLLIINGVEDHVHVLADLHPSIALADFIGKLKANASRWWNAEHPRARIGWQRGYGSFSVSQSKVDDVIAYIRAQEEHHRKKSFQDELRDLLRLHKIEYDEKYLWD